MNLKKALQDDYEFSKGFDIAECVTQELAFSTHLKNSGIHGAIAGQELKKLSIALQHVIPFIPANDFPENPIIEEVVKLSQRLPYTYDDVYQVWASHGKDIEKTKRYFWIED
jgi:hypothetical protein